jgi:hypothetical protein
MALSAPDGMLLLVHSQIYPINEKDILLALPEEQQRLPREIIRIDAPQLKLDELDAVDWFDAKRTQNRLFEERLRPALVNHPGYRVAYFGLAPIPLAMHLGYLFGAMRAVDIYQQHRDDKSWIWHGRSARQPEPQLLPVELPPGKFGGPGDAIVRVATSYKINADDTKALAPQPAFEIDVALEATDLDALSLPEDIELIASSFREALNSLINSLPNLDTIHVFAAVPVGVAFRLGTCINPTLQHQLQVYQYYGSQTPRYKPAFTLKGTGSDQRPLTPEDQEAAAKLRGMWAEEARALLRFSDRQREAHSKGASSWLSQVLPQTALEAKLIGNWHMLPCVFDTPLSNIQVALDGDRPEEGFHYDEEIPAWHLSDRMLLAIHRQLPEDVRFRRAGRLFLLHEGVHIKAHQLTSETSQWIGRFPKVIEEADYQADVWAMLHEFACARANPHHAMPAEREFFQSLLDIALSTIWAFGESPVPLTALPVRRINRYLIWLWQALRIARCSTLSDILLVLAQRPVIELSGLPMKVQDGEFCYLLQPQREDFLELGVLHDTAVRRIGQTHAVKLGDLIDGFRQRDRALVRKALKGAFDTIVPW